MDWTRDDFEKNVEAIKKQFNIVGREREIGEVLAALKRNKHVLLEGPVGVGKTTVALAVAKFLGKPIFRVDGDERYTEHKLVGWFDPPLVLAKGYTQDAFIPGPLTQSMLSGGILYINELNRMPEGTQNVLLPAMDERKIVIPKIGVVEAKPGFVVVATQNPEEFVGTSRLSEALKDRFVRIGLYYQSEIEEEAIVVKETGCRNIELVKLGVRIVRKTREYPDIKRGSSIRGAIDFVDLLKHHSDQPKPPVSAYINAAIIALHTKIETQVRAKKSKEEIIKEIVLASLKEMANEQAAKSEDVHGGETGAERLSGIVTAMTGKNDVMNREESIYRHIMSTFKSKTHIFSDGSLLQMPSIVAGSSLWPMLETYSMLDEEMPEAEKDIIERNISKIVALIAASIGEKGARGYYRKLGSYMPGIEEFDLDLTLEQIVGKPTLEYEDIAAIHKHPKKFAVSLMLDISNSMQRSRVITAAIAVAALAYKLEKDYYAIITFKDKVETLKSMIEPPPEIEELTMKILNLKTGGLTNIQEALRRGAEELELAKTFKWVGERIGIIITDGWVTAGGDPRDVAIRFPKLHCLQVGIGGGLQDSEDLCKDLARIGRGDYIFVEDFSELPNHIIRIFR
jgi:MoxR-like ATPase/Mg-chelatase subunit ChlD